MNAAPHAHDVRTVFEDLGSRPEGLSTADAATALERHGENALPQAAEEPWWQRLLRQFWDPSVDVLNASGVMAELLG